jgi:hypothetical protein
VLLERLLHHLEYTSVWLSQIGKEPTGSSRIFAHAGSSCCIRGGFILERCQSFSRNGLLGVLVQGVGGVGGCGTTSAATKRPCANTDIGFALLHRRGTCMHHAWFFTFPGIPKMAKSLATRRRRTC